MPPVDTLLMLSCLRLLKTQAFYLPYWADTKPPVPAIMPFENATSKMPSTEEPVKIQEGRLEDEDEDEDENDDTEYVEELCRRAPDNSIAKFFNYAANLEISSGKAQTCYIDELDRVLL